MADDSNKKMLWTDLSSFILKHFAKATQNPQVRGKFMWSGAWVQYIKESYDIPKGYDFTVAQFNKAIQYEGHTVCKEGCGRQGG